MRIDRFEGEVAIIELDSDVFFELPRAALPQEASEGDKLVIIVNKAETMAKKEEVQARLNRLFKK
ncbi:MAG: DUF3006 domain-containing protein [Eubacteriales bacterium]|nr:DUF3006 domain-containing protein [Eubacteriales bacterium]